MNVSIVHQVLMCFTNGLLQTRTRVPESDKSEKLNGPWAAKSKGQFLSCFCCIIL